MRVNALVIGADLLLVASFLAVLSRGSFSVGSPKSIGIGAEDVQLVVLLLAVPVHSPVRHIDVLAVPVLLSVSNGDAFDRTLDRSSIISSRSPASCAARWDSCLCSSLSFRSRNSLWMAFSKPFNPKNRAKAQSRVSFFGFLLARDLGSACGSSSSGSKSRRGTCVTGVNGFCGLIIQPNLCTNNTQIGVVTGRKW